MACDSPGDTAGIGSAPEWDPDPCRVLSQPLDTLKGIGPKRSAALREVAISTVGDLLYFLPRRYVDRSRVARIAQAPLGEEVTLLGRVVQVRFVRGRSSRLVVTVEDDSGRISCTWFRGGQYLRKTFCQGDWLALSGKPQMFRGQIQLVHPEFEFSGYWGGTGGFHTGGLIPLYTTSADMKERGLRSRGFRQLMAGALEAVLPQVRDPLPAATRERLDLEALDESLRQVHFPAAWDQMRRARRRLAFDELFALQLELLRAHRRRRLESAGISFPPSRRLVPRLESGLPFELTKAQRRAAQEIARDMASPWKMRRLLQGDVGSGKTVIAACAMLGAVEAGYQAALMAPTEILSEQHFRNLHALMAPLGLRLALLTGARGVAFRRELLTALAAGQIQVVVGTHALIQKEVSFDRLGLAVVDEQHRFGVAQRQELSGKGAHADMLYMTATPIPRSLALSLYGDLDLSVIDELPPGRRPVRTAVRDAGRRGAVLRFAAEQMESGKQVYVVYPLIEESERSGVASALDGYAELRAGAFSGHTVGLVHGRMDGREKAEVMDAFTCGDLQALVSTTVIEVGVDVPNATVMIIEHAERFGLAQLHQLRGRVGRGAEQSYCILMNYQESDADAAAQARLQALCDSHDGFEIADTDLRLRGPGEFFGTRQAGLTDLRVADLSRDLDLLRLARREAEAWVQGEAPASEDMGAAQ